MHSNSCWLYQFTEEKAGALTDFEVEVMTRASIVHKHL